MLTRAASLREQRQDVYKRQVLGFWEAIASFARMILICISADGSDTLIFLLMATPVSYTHLLN